MPHRYPALLADPATLPWAGSGSRRPAFSTAPGREVREDAAVLVEDGVISAVTRATASCPNGARRLDLDGRMLLPGLIDVHTHASGRSPTTLRGAEEALPGTAAHFLQAELRERFARGVTTIRVVGSQGRRPQEARQAMRYGAFRGPRFSPAGRSFRPLRLAAASMATCTGRRTARTTCAALSASRSAPGPTSSR